MKLRSALCVVFWALAATASAQVRQASVVSQQGYLEIERKATGAREIPNRLPAALSPGDKVLVGRDGEAALELADGSRIGLGPAATLEVQVEQEREVGLFLAAGKLWAAVSKRASRRFQVRTPSAIAAVRGTEFRVEVMGARGTAVEVFGGLVSVKGMLGAESMVAASQRVDVLGGRMGEVGKFQPKPEGVPAMMRPMMMPGREGGDKDGKPGEERKNEDGKNKGADRRPAPDGRHVMFDPARFKDFVATQNFSQMSRDQLESRAAFEQKSQLYQEGKTLVDAFGRRVRVEEYILRPRPDQFKFVSFNFRDDRTDLASVEVTANRALPERLADAGNLWFSQGQPSYWAVSQRLTMSNGVDSVVQVGVDGAPQQFTFQGMPVFDPNTNTFASGAGGSFYRTMFGNKYEFINGNAAAIADVYSGAFRPVTNGDVSGAGNTASGMMWRTQPVKINVTDGAVVNGTYWTDAFVKGSGNDGLAYAQTTFQPTGGAAHFVSQRSYFNFQDTNANGILDFGEQDDPNLGGFFHDVAAIMDGTSLTAMAGATTKQAGGDTLIFSDKDGNGAPGGADPQATITYPGAAGSLPLQQALNFAVANPRAWVIADEFAIDDAGKVLPAGSNFNDSAALFSGENFERRLRSSLFSRDIDVVMSPAFIFQSGVSNASNQDRPVPSPGPKF